MPESILNWGIQLILSLQSLSDWLVGPMEAFTFLGNEDFFLLLFPFLYWCIDSRLGIRIGVYLVISLGLNTLLKAAWHAPRPYWFDPRVKLLTGAESSFGIPSGHAQNSVVIWSGIAAQSRRGWGWTVAVVLAFLIGFSRIYLGVHFPTDVLTGWVLGVVVLALAIWLEKPVMDWIRKFGAWEKVSIFFALSLGFILLNVLIIQSVNGSFTVPAAWVETAGLVAEEPIAPLSPSGMITTMAAAFGFISGVVWLETRGGFDARGTWWVRAGRLLVGLAGVLGLRYGLDAVFDLIAVDESLLGYILRYIRYGTIGFWMAALAPLVFIRLKLAHARSE